MLDVQHISISYGTKEVLRDFSLHLGDGELMCVTGESGSGKTSLLNAIMGFVDFSGDILFNGTRIDEHSINEFRRHTSYIPQELNLPVETVEEMVKLPFSFHSNHHIHFDKSRLTEYWKVLGLESELLEKKVTEISGGQRQRIMVSVAGMLEKSLILVDEPTSALDFKSAESVLDFFHMLKQKNGTSILAISHHEKFAAGCDVVQELKGNILIKN